MLPEFQVAIIVNKLLSHDTKKCSPEDKAELGSREPACSTQACCGILGTFCHLLSKIHAVIVLYVKYKVIYKYVCVNAYIYTYMNT